MEGRTEEGQGRGIRLKSISVPFKRCAIVVMI
jgi:hypothetical protein